MNYPSLQVNNFFENPSYIKEFAESLAYEKPPGNYPGLRAEAKDEQSHDLIQKINWRILRLLYPDYNQFKNLTYETTSSFQKIRYEDAEAHILNKEHPGKGWIHGDHESKFTAIVYLSENNFCGTALYSQKSGFNYATCDPTPKIEYYNKSPNLNMDDYYKELNNHLNQFKLDCLFNSSYNKLVGFDGSNLHGAMLNLKPNEERLTFISFFNINAPYYPIPEMRRT
jgi:hypothetical protein